jgi:hypothetical protein
MKRQKSTGQQLALRSNGAHSANASRARRLTRWQATFLKALRRNPNITAAAHAARVSRFTAYKFRNNDENFAAKWDEALDASVDKVEETAFRMANEGDGGMVQFVLKAHRPERYRERQEIDARLLGGIVLIPAKRTDEAE